MKYIDLSYDIKSEMPVYPGDMELNSNKEKDYDKDGFNLYSFSTSMHVGTHIDAPLHMGKNKKFISEYSIDKFIGNSTKIILSEKDNNAPSFEYYIGKFENIA